VGGEDIGNGIGNKYKKKGIDKERQELEKDESIQR
jgi:hypothetical protein